MRVESQWDHCRLFFLPWISSVWLKLWCCCQTTLWRSKGGWKPCGKWFVDQDCFEKFLFQTSMLIAHCNCFVEWSLPYFPWLWIESSSTSSSSKEVSFTSLIFYYIITIEDISKLKSIACTVLFMSVFSLNLTNLFSFSIIFCGQSYSNSEHLLRHQQ